MHTTLHMGSHEFFIISTVSHWGAVTSSWRQVDCRARRALTTTSGQLSSRIREQSNLTEAVPNACLRSRHIFRKQSLIHDFDLPKGVRQPLLKLPPGLTDFRSWLLKPGPHLAIQDPAATQAQFTIESLHPTSHSIIIIVREVRGKESIVLDSPVSGKVMMWQTGQTAHQRLNQHTKVFSY